MHKIIWFTPKALSSKMQWRLSESQRKIGLQINGIFYMSVVNRVPKLWLQKGKKKRIVNPDRLKMLERITDEYIAKIKPKLLIINDNAILYLITKSERPIATCRGSVYFYKGLPAIVVDDLLKAFRERSQEKDLGNEYRSKYNTWILVNDLEKIKRWVDDEQRYEPKFNYKVCNDRHSLDRAKEICTSAVLLAPDIETYGQFISCVGYTALCNNGRLESFVIPLFDGRHNNGAYWDNIADERYAWETIKYINNCPVPKVMQNGSYDAAYFICWNVPIFKYIFDTMHLMHSVWCEAPKSIAFISSILLDNYRYWKDENKGDSKDRAYMKMHTTDIDIHKHWRYCALDCHNTALCGLFLIRLTNFWPWARDNYIDEFKSQIGYGLSGSMTGIKIDPNRQARLGEYLIGKHEEALASIRKMCGEPELVITNDNQLRWLIYDLLGAQQINVGGKYGANAVERSVDKKILELVASQHPILEIFIDKIQECKEPLTRHANYAKMYPYNGRFIFHLKCGATETARSASAKHQFHYGRNSQNWDQNSRAICVADEGFVLFEPDYSKSDAWFMAHTSQDLDMIAAVNGDKDIHCLHAEMFFNRPYEEVYQGYINKKPWVVDGIRGVRQNSKRITHGASFQMAAITLLLTMTKKAVIAAAETLNAKVIHCVYGKARKSYLIIPNHLEPNIGRMEVQETSYPGAWEFKFLIEFCDFLLNIYHKKYRRLRPWFGELVDEIVRNKNRAVTAFGYTRQFFGNVAKDKAIHREATSFYGQGGTAGNIRRSLNQIYYKEQFDPKDFMLFSDTHDSIFCQIRKEKLHHYAPKILTIMEEPVTIHGRSFSVPASGKVGLSWGDNFMIDYRPDITYTELLAHDRMQEEKWCVIDKKVKEAAE